MKRTQYDKEAPRRKARIGQPRHWPKHRLAFDERAGGGNSREVALCDLPSRIFRLPLILQFRIRDEISRLADAHAAGPSSRARTRWRMASKSAGINGVAGLSAASRSHASSSGVAVKGCCRCSLGGMENGRWKMEKAEMCDCW